MEAAWWLNPFKWVDSDDLLDMGGEVTLGRAILVLTDTSVARPVDRSVMAAGVSRAVLASGKLTRRQESALEVARAAAEEGTTATNAVAAALGINRHSAWRLLQRVDGRLGKSSAPKMETSGKFFHIDNVDVNEREIKRVMMGLAVDCAACGKPGCSVRYALCRACFEEYGAPGERVERTRRWLDPLIRQTQTQARKEAIERFYRAEWRDLAAG